MDDAERMRWCICGCRRYHHDGAGACQTVDCYCRSFEVEPDVFSGSEMQRIVEAAREYVDRRTVTDSYRTLARALVQLADQQRERRNMEKPSSGNAKENPTETTHG